MNDGRHLEASLTEIFENGYSANTSSFKNANGRLRTLGFIDYDHGRRRATPIMYPEA